MKKNTLQIMFIFLNFLFFSSAQSTEQVEDGRNTGVLRKNAIEKFEGIKKIAAQKFGAIKNFGAPRIVKKGNLPEITMREDKIYFNGVELRFGQSIEEWGKIISGTSRCTGVGMKLCTWDDIGLQIGTDHEPTQKVTFINIYLNFSESDKYIGFADDSGGSPTGKFPDWWPRRIFPGYLELDGFGIDAETKFWELRNGVSPARSLDCGLMDCSHPSGSFNKNTNIYLLLEGRSEQGRLLEFSLNVIN